MAKVGEITTKVRELAPEYLAADWDNIGLQLGDREQEVERVLITLDINERVVSEAGARGCGLIISHHPFIFKPLSSINSESPTGRVIINAIRNDISLFSAHTNLDIAEGGLNDLLAEQLGLSRITSLEITGSRPHYKLVVFVPEESLPELRQVILDAGAGYIGNYSHTSFAAGGTGTFKPQEGSRPYIGKQGELVEVTEKRLETIVPADSVDRVIGQMLAVHPYEEVAYDLYPLENRIDSFSLGRMGMLPKKIRLGEYLKDVKETLQLKTLRYVGSKEQEIERVAVCSGSGGDLIRTASQQGADLLITGDISYHQAQLAEEIGIALVDAGHYQTEIIVKDLLVDYLKEQIESVEFLPSQINTDPWNQL